MTIFEKNGLCAGESYITTSPIEKSETTSYVTTLVVEEGVTTIGGLSLYGLSRLTEVHLPSTLEEIHGNAFMGCVNLRSITIPASVKSIGPDVFSNCGLETIIFEGDAPLSGGYDWWLGYNSTKGFGSCKDAYYDSSKNNWTADRMRALSQYATWHDMNIVDSGKLSDSASWSYTKTNILTISGTGDLPSYISGNYTPWAAYNNQISQVIIKDGITSISSYTFEYMRNLRFVHLPTTLTHLDCNALNDCSSLTSLTIPASLKEFGAGKNLNRCTSLTDIYYEGTEDEWKQILNYDSCKTNLGVNLAYHYLILHDSREPSCTEDGNLAYYAFDGTLNKAAYSPEKQLLTGIPVIAKLGHSLEYAHERTDPTCIEDGVEAYWVCTTCSLVFADAEAEVEIPEPIILPALGHTLTKHEHKDATCTEDGFEAYWSCNVCGMNFSDAAAETVLEELIVFPAKGHVPIIGIEGFPATCAEFGLTDYIFCEVCEETLQDQEEIPLLPHTEKVTKEAVEPTCTEPGHAAEIICSVCGELLQSPDVIPATGHHYAQPVFELGIDRTTGNFTFVCPDCGDVQILDAAVKEDIQKESTCTEPGQSLYTAKITFEDKPYTASILLDVPAYGHTIVEDAAVPPTDRTNGLTAGTHCSVCGEVFEDQMMIPAFWSYSEDGLTVTAYNGFETDLTIPSGVTALGDTLFKNNSTITSVIVPSEVTQAGTQTFYYASVLRDIWLPDDLDGIGVQTFMKVSAVLHTSMESKTAKALSLRGLNFTDGDWTLRYRLTSLTSEPTAIYLVEWHGQEDRLILPATLGGAKLTTIQSGAFTGRSGLNSITIPDTVTAIADDAFKDCSTDLVIRSSWNAYAHTWACEHDISWVHDQHVATIIKSVDPTCETEGLTEGEICAECGEIIRAQEPVPVVDHRWSEVTYTWSDDFTSLTASRVCEFQAAHIEEETVPAHPEIVSSPTWTEDGRIKYVSGIFQNTAFQNQEMDARIPSLSDMNVLKLPDGITHIDEETFMHTAVQAVLIPDSCTFIGSRAFAQCNSLVYVRVPAGVSIADDAFEGTESVIFDHLR